jgi:hypothetical protein
LLDNQKKNETCYSTSITSSMKWNERERERKKLTLQFHCKCMWLYLHQSSPVSHSFRH